MKYVLTLMAIAVMAFHVAEADDVTNKKVAVIVGVNEYRSAGLGDLNFAVADAEALAESLKAIGFSVVVLSSHKPEALPTRSRITASIMESLKRANGKTDMFLLAFAGHGTMAHLSDGTMESYLVPSDGVKSNPDTLIPLSQLFAMIEENPSGTNLLLLDCCRDESLRNRSRGLDGTLLTKLPARTAAVLACDAGEVALESAKGGHGLLFSATLEAIAGKGVDGDGVLRWNRLVDHITTTVPEQATKLGGEQVPVSIANLRGSPVLGKLSATAVKPDVPQTGVSIDHLSSTSPETQLSAWTLDFTERENLEDNWNEIGGSTFYLRQDRQPHGLCPSGATNGLQQIDIPLDRSLLAQSWCLEVDFWPGSGFEIDLPGIARCPIRVDRGAVLVAGTPSTQPDNWTNFVPDVARNDARLATVRFEYRKQSGRLTISLRRIDNGQFVVFVVLKPSKAKLDKLRLGLGKFGSDVSVVSAIRIEPIEE